MFKQRLNPSLTQFKPKLNPSLTQRNMPGIGLELKHCSHDNKLLQKVLPTNKAGTTLHQDLNPARLLNPGLRV